MIPVIVAQISVSEILDVKASGRVFRAAMGTAHEAMARQGEKYLPRHTAVGATTRYGYRRRSPGYVKKARGINPAWRPLNLSGELEKSLKAQQLVRANYKMGKLIIRAKLGGVVGVTDRFRFKKGQFSLSEAQEQLVMRKAEISATTGDEVKNIGKAGAKAFTAFIKSGNKTRMRVR